MGYMVSITIKTDRETFANVDKGLSTAKDAGGFATLFGIDIGPTAAENTVAYSQIQTDSAQSMIRIPPSDSSQLIVLGIMGKKLATPLER